MKTNDDDKKAPLMSKSRTDRLIEAAPEMYTLLKRAQTRFVAQAVYDEFIARKPSDDSLSQEIADLLRRVEGEA